MAFPEFGAAMTTLKTIAAIAKEAGRIDLTNEVISLQQSVMESVAENTRLATQNAELAKQLSALEARLLTRDQMQFRANVYWRPHDRGTDEGPFCPKCLDGSDRAVRMQDLRDSYQWHCPVCALFTEKPDAPRSSARAIDDYHPHRR